MKNNLKPVKFPFPMNKSLDLRFDGHIFQNNGPRWAGGKTVPSQQFIRDGVIQGTPEYNSFKKDFYRRIKFLEDEAITPENGGTPGYVLVDFGFPASLAPFAPQDNSEIRAKYNLPDPDAEDIKLFKEMLQIVRKRCSYQNLKLNKTSSSGAWAFVTGTQFKKALFNHLKKDEGRKFVRAILQKDLNTCNEYYSYPFYTQGERKHFYPCKWEDGRIVFLKERPYALEKHILEGKFTSDVSDFSHPDPQLGAYDRRSMYAEAFLCNLPNMILNNWIAAGLKCFDIWTYNGPIEQQAKVNERIKVWKRKGKKWRIYSLDKSKFGETFAPRLVQEIGYLAFDCLREDFAYLSLDSLNWPTFYRCIERGTNTCIWSYDWRDGFISLDSELAFKSAFKSGNGMVAVDNKLLGGFDVLRRIKRKIFPHVELETLMQNEHEDIFFQNTGDDTFLALEESVALKFEKHIAYSLHADALEATTLHLGWTYDQTGEFHKDICRFAANIACYERTQIFKMAPRYGFQAMMLDYKGNKYLDKVLEAYCAAMYDKLGHNVNKWLDEKDPMDFSSLTITDRIFLENPQAIYYKLNPDVVSEELLSQYFNNLTIEEYKFMVV